MLKYKFCQTYKELQYKLQYILQYKSDITPILFAHLTGHFDILQQRENYSNSRTCLKYWKQHKEMFGM